MLQGLELDEFTDVNTNNINQTRTAHFIFNENDFFISVEHITPHSRSYANFKFKDFCNFENFKNKFKNYFCYCHSNSTSTFGYICLFMYTLFWYNLFENFIELEENFTKITNAQY